jgi:hypothetical protein
MCSWVPKRHAIPSCLSHERNPVVCTADPNDCASCIYTRVLYGFLAPMCQHLAHTQDPKSAAAGAVPTNTRHRPQARDRAPHSCLVRAVHRRVQQQQRRPGETNGPAPPWIRTVAAVQRVLRASHWRSRSSGSNHSLTIVPWPGTSLAAWTPETSLVVTTAEAKALRARGGVGQREEWSTPGGHDHARW